MNKFQSSTSAQLWVIETCTSRGAQVISAVGHSLSSRFLRLPVLLLAVLLLAVLLNACTGANNFTSPPLATRGDGVLNAVITTDGRGTMPKGANVVITIHGPATGTTKGTAIAGDVIPLSQADRDIKVAIPLDKNKIAICQKQSPCQVAVKIYKAGLVRFATPSPSPFHGGTKNLRLTVTPHY